MATQETVDAGAPMALASTPAARALFARISESVRQAFSQRRPWPELVVRTALAKPESLSDAMTRMRKNWAYFRVNYAILLTAVVALSLITNPGSLFLLCCLLGAWIYVYLFRTGPLVLFNRSFSEREVAALMVVFTIVIVFLTNVGSVIISAAMAGFAIVCAHAAFRVPDDLFLDDNAPAGGFLSILSVPPTVQPPTATNV